MDIILTAKGLIQGHDEFGVASNVALKDVLNSKTACHFLQVVSTTACYITRGYKKKWRMPPKNTLIKMGNASQKYPNKKVIERITS